ncbi:hypothetical protein BIU90_09825 [Curtobacterium sp. MCBA15_001]|nr:hypothetical protein BIU90_09825 [Curtobacterium sp. MCBA15_001]
MTAPVTDVSTGQEAPPAAATPPTVRSAEPTAPPATPPVPPVAAAPAPAPVSRPVLDPDAVVPDYPPSEDLLPPAPTSPALHTAPFDASRAPVVVPAPVSPVDAVREPAMSGPAHQGPLVPLTGQPRFSVPGLEHVVVAGTTDEPVGPVGYRTPARFAHQQSVATPHRVTEPAPTPAAHAFDALVAAPAPEAPEPAPTVSATAPTVDAEPDLPSDAVTDRRRPLGVTPSAALAAVAGTATTGLAAWWFTTPTTVHAAGLLLGLVAVVCGVTTLRDPSATWQRPVALLGTVLGVVGTVVLLWAVASAVLPAGTLPDLTGTGAVPTIAP